VAEFLSAKLDGVTRNDAAGLHLLDMGINRYARHAKFPRHLGYQYPSIPFKQGYDLVIKFLHFLSHLKNEHCIFFMLDAFRLLYQQQIDMSR
jgi:hypothetical protein